VSSLSEQDATEEAGRSMAVSPEGFAAKEHAAIPRHVPAMSSIA